MKYPIHLLKVIEMLKRLPGVGNKSAERYAFQLINWKPERLQELAEAISRIPEKLRHCEECGCLAGEEACRLCEERRSRLGVICVIASSKDAFAIEATREYEGLYHVLGGLLSPIEGKGAETLTLSKLKNRLRTSQIKELIIALDSTVEGDATALYIKNEFQNLSLHVSRLAFGLPMGSSFEYVDGGTLARAFLGRSAF
jgi:recombination protein RecR